MTTKTANLTVQKWGNSLALRIPAMIARSAHVTLGASVEIVAGKDSLFVRVTDGSQLTLAERLQRFDPEKHSGEVMASEPIGKEKF